MVFFARDQLTVRTAVTEQTPCSFQLYAPGGALRHEQKITRSETHFAHGLQIGGIYVYRITGEPGNPPQWKDMDTKVFLKAP